MSHAFHFCAVYCSCLRFGSKVFIYLYEVYVLLFYHEIVGSIVTRLWAGGPGSLLPGSGKGFFYIPWCSRTRRDEQRRKYSKMDKRAKDKLVRSPRENGGG